MIKAKESQFISASRYCCYSQKQICNNKVSLVTLNNVQGFFFSLYFLVSHECARSPQFITTEATLMKFANAHFSLFISEKSQGLLKSTMS